MGVESRGNIITRNINNIILASSLSLAAAPVALGAIEFGTVVNLQNQISQATNQEQKDALKEELKPHTMALIIYAQIIAVGALVPAACAIALESYNPNTSAS